MQAKWFWLGLMCLEISSLAQATVELPKSTEHLLVEMVPMRDGVKLFTTIEVPQQGKKYPVLLLRNLYRRRTEQIAESQDIAGRNFIAIHQDVRGSGRSEGVWHAFLQERNDGEDCLEWIAKQPWCDGRIFMHGASYCGSTQFLAAACGHPALKAIAPEVVAFDYFTPMTQREGVPTLALFNWACACTYNNLGMTEDNPRPKYDDAHVAWKERDIIALGRPVHFWRQMTNPQAFDTYFKGMDANEFVSKIQSPAYLLSGWYDIDASAELMVFTALQKHGGNERVRKFSRCVMGPYTHGGVVGFPGMTETQENRDKLRNKQYKFFLNLLKDENSDPLPDMKPVTYYVMGANEWRGAETWPPQGTTFTPYYLGGGSANTSNGNGFIKTTASASPDDVFISDPANPVPSVGGRWDSGAQEQTGPLGNRKDVLFYRSDELTEPLEIAGPVKAHLFISCSTPETDIAVKVADVFPDGKAYNIVNGIRRSSFRPPYKHLEPMEPGNVYELEFELQSTAHRFLPGHRVMVIIAGQDYGYFTFNRNTGKDESLDAECRQAEIHIVHNEQYPSAIILPVSAK